MSINEKWKYEDLTWPEVNEAVKMKLIPVLPVGTMEQHGPHLPIKMDKWTATEIAKEACKKNPKRLLFMPPVSYGFTTHVMDFPGSVTINYNTFIDYISDVLKSLTYHGFEKIIVINGHGSNMIPLELACRKINLESTANISLASWWGLTDVDKEFMSTWRESKFPGGCAHSGEAETSLALHLDENLIQMDKAVNEVYGMNKHESDFEWVDLWGQGPVSMISWTSENSDTGIAGEPLLATKDKGKMLFDESVNNLIKWGEEFHKRKFNKRKDHHTSKPKSDMPG